MNTTSHSNCHVTLAWASSASVDGLICECPRFLEISDFQLREMNPNGQVGAESLHASTNLLSLLAQEF